MRVAIISDIHANINALEAVYSEIDRDQVDHVFNLGDILYGPLWPLETYEFLRTRRVITVQGNQDRDIFTASSEHLKENSLLPLIVETLPKEGIEWLRNLPSTRSFGDIFLCHGTPVSDLVYLFEKCVGGEVCLREESDILEHIGACKAPVIVCGHSHHARVVRVSTGQIIVNPGSVGLPAYSDTLPVKHRIQAGSPDASFAILEKGATGWSVELRRVPYDFASAAQKAREFGGSGSRLWAEWVETGRANL